MMTKSIKDEMMKSVTLSNGCAKWLESMAREYDVDVDEIVFRLMTMVKEDAVDLEEYSW